LAGLSAKVKHNSVIKNVCGPAVIGAKSPTIGLLAHDLDYFRVLRSDQPWTVSVSIPRRIRNMVAESRLSISRTLLPFVHAGIAWLTKKVDVNVSNRMKFISLELVHKK
jgi:hypothetical protein